MSKRHLALALAVGVLIACSSDAELSLNVMSFNVRLGTANDGKNSWPNRRDIVVDCIKQYDPDIVGMQECFGFQEDYIVERLRAYYIEGGAGFEVTAEHPVPGDGVVDLLVTRPGERVAIEIETGKSDIRANIKKLAARYPDKFREEDALHRNLDAERKILED